MEDGKGQKRWRFRMRGEELKGEFGHNEKAVEMAGGDESCNDDFATHGICERMNVQKKSTPSTIHQSSVGVTAAGDFNPTWFIVRFQRFTAAADLMLTHSSRQK